jgi:hypothetical protein
MTNPIMGRNAEASRGEVATGYWLLTTDYWLLATLELEDA